MSLANTCNSDLMMVYLQTIAEQRPSAIINAHRARYALIADSADSADSLDSRLVELIKQGKKVSAIKLCREETSLMLLEARDYIYKLAENRKLKAKQGSQVNNHLGGMKENE